MKQLTQKFKTGQVQIVEVAYPDLSQGSILVKNFYSLISAGTESSTIKTARKGYLGKAKERPREVKKVVETLVSQGPVQTYRAVMKKLDNYSPLGYSCVGKVIDVGEDVFDAKIGDLVACGGSTASHAEIVALPINLCVKLPIQIQDFEKIRRLESETDGIEEQLTEENGKPMIRKPVFKIDDYLKTAAYNTLGAIAMQGMRQADLRLGETCAIIGMGLLGHLTAALLKASGVKVVGIDINSAVVELGKEHCLDLGLLRNDPGIISKISEFTDGIGCDAVIITAASSSLDPINFAGEISRKRSTVVVVGAVPTGFDRDPHYYKKELAVKMSCSYGPGRYDPEYEGKGHDYPVGYVRWTEKRNMQAFQALIAEGKIDIGYLTTHVFKLEEVPKAYDLILEKEEPYLGILISYDQEKEYRKSKVDVKANVESGISAKSHQPSAISIGFIGAGSYAQSHLLPNIPKDKDLVLKGVMTSTSTSSRSVVDRYGFEFCTGNEDDILGDDGINTVFIATRHDSHGYYAKKALEAGKRVFVEKPLCLTEAELEEIKLATDACRLPLLMVGYNRRFSPLTNSIKEKMAQGPFSILYRINAGMIPPESWIQDKDIGGGRILGEVCHFVDYLTYINGSFPVSVFAATMEDSNHHHDTLTVSLKYQNGSVGSIQYFANGSKSLPKEYVEIYAHGVTAVLTDYRKLKIFGKGKPYKKKLVRQDKGQKNEMRLFLDAVKRGGKSPIPLGEIFIASEVCFKIIESIRTGKNVKLSSD